RPRSSGPRLRPEIEKIVPLQRIAQAVGLEPPRVALGMGGERRLLVAARQLDALGEALEIDAVTAALAQAEHEIDRAAEQMGDDVRPLREGRVVIEKARPAGAIAAVDRRAVAGDRHPAAVSTISLSAMIVAGVTSVT